MNLLKETEEFLQEFRKTFDDVRWIGGHSFTIPIDLFKELADTEYDNGFGSPEVALDLKIVGDDWWLERRYEYDGAEKWVFKTFPRKPLAERTVPRVITRNIGWKNLEEIF